MAAIVVDDEDRENEGDFIMLAEKATPETVNFMAKMGRGLTGSISHLLTTALTTESRRSVPSMLASIAASMLIRTDLIWESSIGCKRRLDDIGFPIDAGGFSGAFGKHYLQQRLQYLLQSFATALAARSAGEALMPLPRFAAP
mgnify:CR=1 FL=1